MDELEFDLELPRVPHRQHGRRRPRAAPIHMALGGEFADIADILLKLRVLQSFSQDPTRYPLHRVVRFAARQEMPELFDALAMDGGFKAHRLGEGELMLDGPDTFVSATGRRKTDYTSCEFAIWAHSRQALENARERLLGVVGDTRLREEMFTVDWRFTGAHGLSSATFEESADPAPINEAYPALGEPVGQFITRYLESKEVVLILQGPPGTGKSRLVRAILAALSRRKGENAQVLTGPQVSRGSKMASRLTAAHDLTSSATRS